MIRSTTITTMAIANPPQSGAVTHHQDQSITLHSLRIRNTRNVAPNSPMPPLVELLSLMVYSLADREALWVRLFAHANAMQLTVFKAVQAAPELKFCVVHVSRESREARTLLNDVTLFVLVI